MHKTIQILLLSAGLCLANGLSGQSDSLFFQLASEWEYSQFFTAYSGTFNQQDADYLHVASNDLGLVTFYIDDEGQLAAIDTLTTTTFNGHKVTNVVQDGAHLYVSLGGFQGSGNNPGLAIVDVSEPMNMEILSVWDTTAFEHGCAITRVAGDFAYLGLMEDGLMIMDVSDKSHPRFVSQLMLQEDYPVPPGIFSVPHSRGLEIVGDFAFVCQDAGGFRVVDISNKEQPEEVGQYVSQYILDNAARAYNNVAISGDLAFIGVDYCGVEAVDISNPLEPVHVSHYNPWDCSPTNWADGEGHANEVIVDEEQQVLFVSAGDSELLVLNISNPSELTLLGRFGGLEDSVATWGIALHEERVALFQIDNSPIPDWIPQPFYSDYGGVRLLDWERINTSTRAPFQPEPLKLWPNPSSELVHLELPEELTSQPLYLTVYNLQGQAIWSDWLVETNPSISVVNWPSGLYLYRLSTMEGNLLATGRLVRQ